MLWEIEIQPTGHDAERDRVCEEYLLLTHHEGGDGPFVRSARGYLVEGDLAPQQTERLMAELLIDPLVESGRALSLHSATQDANGRFATVLLKPGVMDPAALSVEEAARGLGLPVESVGTFRRYYFNSSLVIHHPSLKKVLANDAIEHVIDGPLSIDNLALGTPYTFRVVSVLVWYLVTG